MAMYHPLREPLLIALVCVPLSMALLRRWRPDHLVLGRWLWRLALAFLVAGMLGPVIAAAGHMVFHDEPTLIAITAAEFHGQPLYHAANAATRYSLLYGPVAFWAYLPPMLAGVVDLRAYQLWVIVPLFLAGWAVVLIVRKAGDPLGSAFALLPYAAAVVMQTSNEWAMKGDAWMLLLASAQLAAALFLPQATGLLLVALCGALLVNIKLTAALLAVVPVIALGRRYSRRVALLAGLLMLFLVPLPFLVPGVSASNFLFWLQMSARHGISPKLALSNTAFLFFIALPPLILLFVLFRRDYSQALTLLRRHLILAVSIVAACLTAIVTGAKVGAGPWHCAPLAPMLAWLTAALWPRLRQAKSFAPTHTLARVLLLSVVLAQVAVAALGLRSGILTHWKGGPTAFPVSGHLVAQDLASIVQSHPHTQIQMGYGGDQTYELTWQRPILVLLGSHYDLDADQLNETGYARLPLPAATLDNLRNCASPLYLIPKGDTPFSMQSPYYIDGASAPQDLFPEAFRAEFLKDYRKTESSRYFDFWSCRR